MLRLAGYALAALVATTAPVAADPLTTAIASMASASVAGGGLAATFGNFTAFGLSLTGTQAVFAHFAVRAALGYALDALSPNAGGNRRVTAYGVNSIGPAQPHAVILGKTRVGGAIFYQATTGASNRYLHRCIAFAGHEVESFEKLYLNDTEVTINASGDVTAPSEYVGYVRLKVHTGSTSQAADSDLVSEVTEWTTAHQAKGVAYIYARFDHSASVFPNGVPTVTAEIKGLKVYDPRSATTAWTDNPAICLRGYMAEEFGFNESAFDDTLLSVAANICDEHVSGLARYTCNGAFTLDVEPETAVRNILASMGGVLWFAQGEWGAKAAAYVSPDKAFDEDDLRGPVKITKHSRRDNFNTIKGTYRGAETQYQDADYPSVTNATYVTEDDGETIHTDLPLPFVNTSARAQRIATIALNRQRQQLTVSAAFGLRAMNVRVGDVIQLTLDRMGWSSKEFEVTDWRFSLTSDMDLQVSMMLREIDSTVFD